MTTMRDVAKACGVSVATVSGVLNNTPDAAGPETRERVLEMIQQMNYSPNAVARGLSHRRMNTIGVVMDYGGWGSLIADQHLGPIVDGIVGQSSRRRQKTLLYTEAWADAVSNIPAFCDGFCDGLLLIVPMVSEEFFARLFHRRTPFVIIGDHRIESNISIVDLDNIDAGRQITEYLIGLGHKRIAMLRGEDNHHSSRLRAQGYQEALSAQGLEYDPALDIGGGYNCESGYDCTIALLDRPKATRPTALFCGDDRIALGALSALQERGVRVPEEMSVVGINNSVEGVAADTPLTSLRQPGQEIGEQSVDLLLSHIKGEEEPGRKIILPGSIIIRGTSGPAL
ncbi:MAG: LacI family DNA-binding transcriptional regulator [Capsulimonas sp.]|uniref:LacI family DNA-binding transcriptional regulator n=1 Tax=Capsulimonas sp. TaxID=2494211 RepID=UPI003267B657